MFAGASSLQKLDFSSWSSRNLYNMDYMFEDADSLSNITFGPNFNIDTTVALPDVPDTGFTGKWVSVEGTPEDGWSGTSEDLMELSENGNARGQYVWERVNPLPDGVSVERLAGPNRYSTNYEVNKADMTAGKPLFVATGDTFPDALSIGPVVSLTGGSLLLVPRTTVAQDVLQLVKDRAPSEVYIIGGTGAVTDQVVNNIETTGRFTTSRLAGENRYSTNMAVNSHVNAKKGGVPSITGVWVATGTDFPDALSAAGPAGRTGQRLVLSAGTCIPKPVVSSWITSDIGRVTQVNLVGGTGVLKPALETLPECP